MDQKLSTAATLALLLVSTNSLAAGNEAIEIRSSFNRSTMCIFGHLLDSGAISLDPHLGIFTLEEPGLSREEEAVVQDVNETIILSTDSEMGRIVQDMLARAVKSEEMKSSSDTEWNGQ